MSGENLALERVVATAVAMRAHVLCSVNSIDGIVMEDAPYKGCECGTCVGTRKFDAAMAALAVLAAHQDEVRKALANVQRLTEPPFRGADMVNGKPMVYVEDLVAAIRGGNRE